MLLRAYPFRPLVLGFLLGSAPFAHADVLYNLTLTSADGYAGGTGSFTINTPPPATGVATYLVTNAPPNFTIGTPGDFLLAFNVSLQSDPAASFTLQSLQPPDYPYVQFTDGVATELYGFFVEGGTISSGDYTFYVSSTSYSYSFLQYTGVGFPSTFNDGGSVTITPAAVATTPEPSTLAFVGTGLVGLAAILSRRIRRPSVAQQ